MAFGRGRRTRRDDDDLGVRGPESADPGAPAPRDRPEHGPWDSSEVEPAPGGPGQDDPDGSDDPDESGAGGNGGSGAAGDGVPRIDVGCLRVPMTPGLDLRVDVGPRGEPTLVRLVGSGSEMQLGAFAAPRTAGIWDDVREEIATSLRQQGGEGREVPGPHGVELHADLPTPSGVVPGRFVGIDGPRWFVRALIVGAAARDETAAAPFLATLRELVVVRGDGPRPVREPLPLVLPEAVQSNIAAQLQARGTGSDPT